MAVRGVGRQSAAHDAVARVVEQAGAEREAVADGRRSAIDERRRGRPVRLRRTMPLAVLRARRSTAPVVVGEPRHDFLGPAIAASRARPQPDRDEHLGDHEVGAPAASARAEPSTHAPSAVCRWRRGRGGRAAPSRRARRRRRPSPSTRRRGAPCRPTRAHARSGRRRARAACRRRPRDPRARRRSARPPPRRGARAPPSSARPGPAPPPAGRRPDAAPDRHAAGPSASGSPPRAARSNALASRRARSRSILRSITITSSAPAVRGIGRRSIAHAGRHHLTRWVRDPSRGPGCALVRGRSLTGATRPPVGSTRGRAARVPRRRHRGDRDAGPGHRPDRSQHARGRAPRGGSDGGRGRVWAGAVGAGGERGRGGATGRFRARVRGAEGVWARSTSPTSGDRRCWPPCGAGLGPSMT